jgi:hypothetical protein
MFTFAKQVELNHVQQRTIICNKEIQYTNHVLQNISFQHPGKKIIKHVFELLDASNLLGQQ